VGSITEAKPKRWVDPFVLPTGMTFRFALLVVSVLATSAYYLWLVAPPGVGGMAEATSRCLTITGLAGSAHLAVSSDLDAPYLNTVLARYNQCLAPAERTHAWWILGLLGTVIAVTGITYWLMPWWKIRRSRLVALADSVSPQAVALQAELHALVAKARLARAPVFLLDPLSSSVGGLAFGRFGRYYIRLDAGLVVLRGTDPDGFRAVVRHELAHLRNRDVNQTYLAVALWRAFVLLIVALLAAALLRPGLMGYPRGTGVFRVAPFTLSALGRYWAPLAALVAMVYLTRNAILRSRELYADLRAAELGAGGNLARMFRLVPGRSRVLPVQIRGLLSSHPDEAARRAATDDPGRLFRFGFWEAAAAGGAVSLIYALFALALSGSPAPSGAAFGVPALVLAGTAGGLMTLALWRSTTNALVNRRPPPSVLRPAAGLWTGLVLTAAVLARQVPFGQTAPAAAVTGAVLAMSAWWITSVAAAWLPAIRKRTPRWAWPAAAAAGSVIIAAEFELWLAPDGVRGYYPVVSTLEAAAHARAGSIGWTGPRWLWNLAFLPTALGPAAIRLAFIALLLIWAVPLAAWARAVPAAAAGWQRGALPREYDPAPLPRARVRIGPVAAAGAVAGGLALTGQFALRAVLHASLPLAVRRTDILAVLLTYWELGIAVLAQVIVAAAVAATARRYSVALGMLAASITAGLAALGTITSARVGSCVTVFAVRPEPCVIKPTGTFVALVLQLTTLDGGAAALLAAVVAVSIRVTLRMTGHGVVTDSEPDPNAQQAPAPPSAPRRPFQPAAIAGVAAALAAATAMAWPNPGSAPGSVASTALLSPLQPTAAVDTWWTIGGKNLAGALIHDEGAIIAAARHPDSATELRSACAATRVDATRAINFARIPDTTIQRVWRKATTQFHRGAGECLTAVSGTGDQAAAARSGADLLNGAKALNQALGSIHSTMHS
jgi:Zn-dependent protease with chaperone function